MGNFPETKAQCCILNSFSHIILTMGRADDMPPGHR